MKIFEDREEAAKELLESFPCERMRSEQWQFVAISSGGLKLASYLNKRLGLPIDFLFSASITAPHNSECEIARVCETEEIVIHEELCKAFGIQFDYVYGEATRKHEEKILPQIYRYRKGRPFESKKGKVVLIVDEGAESGLRLMMALKAILTQRPKAVYVAVPVLPEEVLMEVDRLVDHVFYVSEVENYKTTTCYYKTLERVDDATIEKLLKIEKIDKTEKE
ncbi:MAG: phosphoribosyltransferase [Campylobacterales bacterium]|nr:phosphoribosyltransferase [Campylobacterales bacterium]